MHNFLTKANLFKPDGAAQLQNQNQANPGLSAVAESDSALLPGANGPLQDVEMVDAGTARDTSPRRVLPDISPEEEQELLASPAKDAMHGQARERDRLCGAARKRLKRYLDKGMTYEEARELAKEPIGPPRKAPSANKRNRSNSSTPPERASKRAPTPEIFKSQASNPKPSNKANMPPGDSEGVAKSVSFRDALCGVKLGVIPEDYPNTIWSTEQLKAIQSAFLKAVRSNQNSAVRPIFGGCTFRPGWLSLSCRDATTVKWVKELAPKLTPWKGAKLKIVEDADAPRRIIFVGFFPELDSSTNEDTMLLLQGQNEGLKIMDWRILNRVHKSTVDEVTISVDPISAEIIRRRDSTINYGFGVVKLREKAKPSLPMVSSNTTRTDKEEQPCCSKTLFEASKQPLAGTSMRCQVRQSLEAELGKLPATQLETGSPSSPSPPQLDSVPTPSLQQVLQSAQKDLPVRSSKPIVRPPLSSKSVRKGEGNARTAEEKALLGSNRGKKMAARSRKDRK